jgi:acetyl esterase/lipase
MNCSIRLAGERSRYRYLPALLSGATLYLFGGSPSLAGTSKEAIRSVRSVVDVVYYDGAGANPTRHKLDLYLPKEEKDFPVVVFVHGGAWQRGSKEFMGVYKAIGTHLARHGVGVAVINYRLSPAVQHPEHVRDVARALAWTQKNIASYGGRPDKIFLCGHSAGGHLVSLLATDPIWIKEQGLKVDAIRGVISLSGVYDLNELPELLAARTFGPAPDVLNAASPTYQARGGLPPFLLLYADHDLPGCDRKPAEAFAKALNDKGTKAELHEIADSNHYRILLSCFGDDDPVCNSIMKFIESHAGSR